MCSQTSTKKKERQNLNRKTSFKLGKPREAVKLLQELREGG